MDRQWGVLLLLWMMAMAWLGHAHETVPTDADLWHEFERSADARLLDTLILRGAFGQAGIPEFSDWILRNEEWIARIRALHPLETPGPRCRARR
ncbi:hypothetical protein Poly30_32790 [Planctomycetes bacterium Poly30]|uniref:Uncharacterized protein n=1 Tax=Saltatorellus ferox TaxID=2528018 RepID=A0A518EUG4_9BACT|nr:hypothetical protein Poly30_32790 [Planctomycetes bacterium Poly30]